MRVTITTHWQKDETDSRFLSGLQVNERGYTTHAPRHVPYFLHCHYCVNCQRIMIYDTKPNNL